MATDPHAAYRTAGVDVAAGDALVARIAPAARRTARPGAAPALGGFGAMFDLDAAGHAGSLLVAATDGVGTKLRLAVETGLHRGVGIDLVAMCVNDLLAQGAEPLFFLDYYATGALDPDVAASVIEGIADGCIEARCALIGGETAEMPQHYAAGDYDLAGFAVGAVARRNVLPRPTRQGDVLLGLGASGAHANGFSLIRRLGAERSWDLLAPFGEESLAEILMRPTRIYVRSVLAALAAHGEAIRSIAHITGGGLTGNVPRALAAGTAARIDAGALPPAPLMAFLASEGNFDARTMAATFNCGIGLVLAVAADAADAVAGTLRGAGETPVVLGEVVVHDGPPSCRIE